MTTALYLIGPPGVGKTTVTDALLEPYVRDQSHRLHGLLWGESLLVKGPHEYEEVGVHLGSTRDRFGGTDTLGMSVQADAIRWVEDEVVPCALWPYQDGSAARVIGEGARLGNAPFLTVLAKHTDLTVVHLRAPEVILDERCARRGSEQKASWRKGAATRAERTAERCEEAGVKVVRINGGRMLGEVIAQVRDASGW